MVHGWIMTSIMSQDMSNGISWSRNSLGECELDSYQNSLIRIVVESMLNPQMQALKYYIVLPAMPDTFFEQSPQREDDTPHFFSNSVG